MKVYLNPPYRLSRAMTRVARALTAYAPPEVEIVPERTSADLEVLHVVGTENLQERIAQCTRYAMIQYCLKTTSWPDPHEWAQVWGDAKLVWSYYDLREYMPANFYHAPLGVDAVFEHTKINGQTRDIGVMSSGYVSGVDAEAIEEVAQAGSRVGKIVMHLGPTQVVGMTSPPAGWQALYNIDDVTLAGILMRSQWVSGLRHTEGFELPALEGLMCGARPIVFDRPDMRQWYDRHAVFVKDCAGPELIDLLEQVFTSKPTDVSVAERRAVAARFHWKTIAHGFWSRIL